MVAVPILPFCENVNDSMEIMYCDVSYVIVLIAHPFFRS